MIGLVLPTSQVFMMADEKLYPQSLALCSPPPPFILAGIVFDSMPGIMLSPSLSCEPQQQEAHYSFLGTGTRPYIFMYFVLRPGIAQADLEYTSFISCCRTDCKVCGKHLMNVCCLCNGMVTSKITNTRRAEELVQHSGALGTQVGEPELESQLPCNKPGVPHTPGKPTLKLDRDRGIVELASCQPS